MYSYSYNYTAHIAIMRHMSIIMHEALICRLITYEYVVVTNRSYMYMTLFWCRTAHKTALWVETFLFYDSNYIL